MMVSGGTPSTTKPANYTDNGIPWITPADLSGYKQKFISKGARDITTEGLESSSAVLMPEGAVLFSSRAPIGYVAVAGRDLATNQGFKSFIPPVGIESDYLYYYLRYAKPLALKLASGTTFLEISGRRALQLPFVIAPINEQRRIVQKIEELFSKLDAGVAALERVKANLKRYRAAVLKAAVEGKLTAEWRAEHPDTEPASQLLERILKERRRKWEEAQLAKYTAAGKEPPKGWREKYEELAQPNTGALSELPPGWCWTSVEQLTLNFDGQRVPVKADDRKKRQGPFPYYGASGIIDHVDDYLFDGDFLLIAEDGANLLSRSTPIAFRASGRFWVNNHAHILQSRGGIPLAFLETYFNSIPLNRHVTGTAQPKMTQAAMNRIAVPLAPLAEQAVIVAEVERRLSIVDELEAQVAADLKRAGRLRQSILKRAFAGRLVPQDPDDEPAAKLLERIRESRSDEKRTGHDGSPARPRGKAAEKRKMTAERQRKGNE